MVEITHRPLTNEERSRVARAVLAAGGSVERFYLGCGSLVSVLFGVAGWFLGRLGAGLRLEAVAPALPQAWLVRWATIGAALGGSFGVFLLALLFREHRAYQQSLRDNTFEAEEADVIRCRAVRVARVGRVEAPVLYLCDSGEGHVLVIPARYFTDGFEQTTGFPHAEFEIVRTVVGAQPVMVAYTGEGQPDDAAELPADELPEAGQRLANEGRPVILEGSLDDPWGTLRHARFDELPASE